MKASEFIQVLKKAIADHGDQDLTIYTDDAVDVAGLCFLMETDSKCIGFEVVDAEGLLSGD
jgi:hypothetical protein